MQEFIYGMTHYCLEEGQIRLEDVFQKLDKVKFWINVMHHHMEVMSLKLIFVIHFSGFFSVLSEKF